jgi:hypothetical protein
MLLILFFCSFWKRLIMKGESWTAKRMHNHLGRVTGPMLASRLLAVNICAVAEELSLRGSVQL